MSAQRCIDCGNKAMWIILGINLGLFIVKLTFTYISQSKSLLADTLESLANVIVNVVVIIGLAIVSRKADDKYPYGYGKMEFLTSGIVNIALMFAAICYIIVSFVAMLMIGPEKPPGLSAIVAALISIVFNQVAFNYGRCVGEKLGSASILANATASRADVGTSVAVIVAVIGSNLGFTKFDHVMGIAIGVLIVKITWDGVRKAIQSLMDVSLCAEERHVRNLTEDLEGVERVEEVKVRLVGRKLWVDLNVFVPADWMLSRALETARNIREVLGRKMENVSDVSVQLLPGEREK